MPVALSPRQINKLKSASVRLAALGAVGAILWSALLPISAFALENSSNAPAATNKDTNVQASEVASALSKTDGVLEASSQVKTTSDSDSAIKAATAGATIDVPKDASQGVTLGSSNGSAPAIDISIPNADQAKDAKKVANGTVAYAGNNGSASAVQATEDGGVRMLTIIDNPSAPTTYDYKVTVPSGGHIELTNEGGAMVIGSDGQPIVSVATPWAKDANGRLIETYFTTDGQTLTQTIKHNVPGVVYPVTADPWWMNRFWSYVGCITGIGVPIGAAYVIAALPASWPFIYTWAVKQSMNGDRAIISYVTRVHNACGRFMQ